jgi:DNA modification methylase
MKSFLLKLGDCLVLLKSLPDNSVDAVVTDPPYELGFMGKKWDASGIAYNVDLWREVLRVLKPGGHLLSFGGTRTYHRMTCAIEDAGFEIRDSLHWMYGTGFPKSLNISKAIDNAAGVEREVIGANKWASNAGAPGGNHVYVAQTHSLVDTAPSTVEAKQWDGWGTALKPGHEPIVLARKPLIGTVATNVLAHGTGGLNIDGSRIGIQTFDDYGRSSARADGSIHNGSSHDELKFGYGTDKQQNSSDLGRWPANVILDEDAAAELDQQSGVSKSTGGQNGNKNGIGSSGIYGKYQGVVKDGDPGLGDTGGASRFFYVAKPSRKERDAGCEQLPLKSAGEVTGGREEGSAGLDNPRAGAGRTSGARNFHPTVKPIALMRHLVKLITPPNGVVLDPFLGSGTTGCAAVLEGFRFMGFDLTEDYLRIAEARIAYWSQETEPVAEPSLW